MIGKFRNLGPKSVQMMHKAGVEPEDLKRVGSVQAYLKVKAIWPGASLNLLWALEGAVCDEPWQEVARHKRLSLLMALEEEKKKKR